MRLNQTHHLFFLCLIPNGRSTLRGRPEAGLLPELQPLYSNQKLKRTELRRVGKIKGRNGAAYWDAWATRDKGEFGHSTYMVTVYTKDGIKDNVDDFASSKLGIPKTTKPANPDEIL